MNKINVHRMLWKKERGRSKAQVTLFIIAGLALLIGALLVLYFFRLRIISPAEIGIAVIPEAPEEIRPIQRFVTGCLEAGLEESLRAIGQHGGYIKPRFIYHPFEPTEGEAVQLGPESTQIIPYWWFLKSANTCTGTCQFDSHRPPLKRRQGAISIERQLDGDVKAFVLECTGDFEAVKPLLVTALDQPRVSVNATAEDVIAYMDWPLRVEQVDRSWDLTAFAVKADVHLTDIYALATKITELQAEHRFLERHAKNLLSAFGRTEEEGLPPFYDLTIEIGLGVVWMKRDVEERVRGVLSSYMQFLRVWGTRNYRKIKAPTRFSLSAQEKEQFDVVYNRGMTVPLDTAGTTYPDIEARFLYLDWWKPYFDLNCLGELCGPDGFVHTLGFVFGLKRYTFTYDLSFPVMVELFEPDAFGGRGYSFVYFLEGNLRNNDPMPQDFKPFGIALEPAGSLVCNSEQWSAGPVEVTATNWKTKAGVEDVLVQYSCGDETCILGITDSEGKLSSALPTCVGGTLGLEHQEYGPEFIAMDSDVPGTQQMDIDLYPYQLVPATAVQLEMKKGPPWVFDATPVNPPLGERILVTLARKTEANELPVVAVAEISGDPTETGLLNTLRLLPGTYDVQITSFLYPREPLVFPPDRRCFSSGFLGLSEECVDVPPQPLIFTEDQAIPTGGAKLEWELTPQQLYAAKEVEFRSLRIALDKIIPPSERKIEDFELLAQYPEWVEASAGLFVPKVKT